MGLSARWLVSFALLVLPVAVTLGILFGLQSRYEADGNTGFFGGSPDDGGPKRLDDSIIFERNCDIAYGLGHDQRWDGQEYQCEYPRGSFNVATAFSSIWPGCPFVPDALGQRGIVDSRTLPYRLLLASSLVMSSTNLHGL